jgi:hypothetical protein
VPDTAEQIKEAEAQGWQSDFEGDNKKTAAEFIHDGRFFKQIDDLKQKNNKLQSSFETLTSHYEKVRVNDQKKAEADYNEKIDQLKQEKVTALDEGDNIRVVEIDEQLRATEKPVEQPINPNPQNPEFEKWSKDNEWYGNSTFLQIEADKVGEFYYGKGLRGTELFTAIGDHVKELHPEKFENQSRQRAPSVEEGTPVASKPVKGKVSEKDLTQNEREVYRNFKANGVFKTDEDVQTYFRQVVEIR